MKCDVSRYKNGIRLEIKQFVAFYAKRVSKKIDMRPQESKFFLLRERVEAKQIKPNTLKCA